MGFELLLLYFCYKTYALQSKSALNTSIVKTSNGSVQSSTTAATSASAHVSTSTASPITKKSSTEVSSTEATTMTTSLPSPHESSSISTTSGTETLSTSIQISTILPSTSSATPINTSEASTTQTTILMTVEPPIVPATVNPNEGIQEKEFNITFTVLKLPFISNLQNHNSSSYKAESNNILDALSKVIAKSDVKSFLHCRSVSFRPASDGNSTVEVICTFKMSTNTPQVDKVGLYHKFQNNTKGITTLGPYTLDSNSLYVDGYHESTVVTTAEASTANTQTSTEALTSTTARASPSPAAETSTASSTHTSTSEATTVSSLATTTAVATKASTANKQPTAALPTSTTARASPSPAAETSTASSTQTSTSEATTVTLIPSTNETLIESTQVSTTKLHSTSSKLTPAITVRFAEVSTTETTTITKLASVEPPIIPATGNPNEGTQEREFNITFTVLSLPFTPNLQNLSSPLYLAVSSSILDKLSNLYVNSKVKSAFLRCQSASFRPASDGNSTVEAICTFKKSADTSQTDKVKLYHEFQNNTKGITALGNYTLDSSSLYVDGYHESAVLTTTVPTVTMTQTPSFEEKPIEFNVTFVITNLQFTESLHNPTSSLYNSVSKNISHQLTDLYNNSKINARFSDCKAVSFRPADVGNTHVFAICTFRNNSDPQEVNRITMYRAFRDNTKNISTFGIYTLDSNSLFVNGYHETMPLPTTLPAESTTKSPSFEGTPIEFNVTFVITNLQFTESLRNSSSSLYNSVSKNISYQLTDLYNNSKINSRFTDCKAVSFRPEDVAYTRVYTICTFRNDSDPQEVNRITVYHAFRDNTKNISTLGAYRLDSNSLYVNGYHESTLLPTTLPTASTTKTSSLEGTPIEFNVTFVMTNLQFTESLRNSSSSLYNAVSKNISNQLTDLYDKSKINARFSDCKAVSFRPANVANTRVYIICTFRNNPDPQEVNRITVYRAFRDNTKNISALGTYTLDSNSLYVNGYHESTPLPTTLPNVSTTQTPIIKGNPIEFNVTFVITNLEFTESLRNSSASLYNAVSSNISYQLTDLYNKSKINTSFSDCKAVSFRPADVASTRVYAICTFRNNSDPQEVNRITVYHAFRDNTKNISALGTYTLDSNSLCVNGYQESTPLPTTFPPVTTTSSLKEKPIEFNVTFVVTNLQFTENLQNSNSSLYNAVSKNISYQLTDVYNKSKINARFSDCQTVSFRPADVANTRVYVLCTFRNDSDPQEVNRITMYHAFRDNTKNISTLGAYTLDSNSLYVNGYHEITPLPTTLPTMTTTQTPSVKEKPVEFSVTFVITNLEFTESLQKSNSSLYSSVTKNISYQLTDLYNNSKINARFSDCKALSFRPEDVAYTRVYAICTFRNDSDPQEVNKITVYRAFRDNTKNISTLGVYTLDSNSLYVNGYHELILPPTISPIMSTTSHPEMKTLDFNVTFIITNLAPTTTLQNSTTALYKSAANIIAFQLGSLFNNSNIKTTFSSCRVMSLSLAKNDATSMYAICTFRNDSTAQEANKVTVYHEFRDNTRNISTLGSYLLDNNSLYVNGYHESTPSSTVSPIISTTQSLQAQPFDFNVTFIITKLILTANLQFPYSALYKSTANIITYQMNNLFNNSKINRTFSSCRVRSFSLASIEDTSVDAVCTFRNDSNREEVNKVTVYHTFRDNTKSISTLGPYSLDNNSLYVNGYHESVPSSTMSPIMSTTVNVQTKPFDFNVTFIITNLILTATLQSPSSALYKSAANIIAYQMNSLFNNSKINRSFSNCRVRSFSLANMEDTSVDAVCTFRNDSNPQEVNKFTVYHIFRDNTKSISTLGGYSLDTNSLYVNDYHESVPLSTVLPVMSTTPNLQPFDFNVTFIITNLALTATLQSSSSALHKSAANIIAYQMNNLFSNSKINKTFLSCNVHAFSLANIEDTSVDAVCTFGNDSNPQEVNKVTIYHTFRDNTKSISTLGAYSLDTNSLYINDYHEAVPSSTVPPMMSTSPNLPTKPFDFNVTFIITNLALTATLQSSSSALYKSAANIIAYQMNNLFTNSKINRTFLSCKVCSFSLANIQDTSVDAVCSFRNDSNPQEVNKVTVYHTFRDNTKSISALGAYSLDHTSLYVNVSPTVSTTPNLQTQPFDFNVTFIITNLALTVTLQSSSSALYKSAANIIAYQLNNLFTNSKINRTFSRCRVRSFSLANIQDTSVDAVCSFRNDSNPQEVNKVTIYHTFRDNTKSISTLGAYSLDTNSLYVNDYYESVPSSTVSPTVSTTPNLQTQPFDFNVTFIITNLALTATLQSSSSALYKSAANIIAYQLNNLFTNSKINKTFSSCRVRSFSLANIEDTSMDAVCSFRNDSNPQEVNKVTVYHTFRDNTKSISTLGAYSLDTNSLYVNDYHEAVPSSTEEPVVIVTQSPNEGTRSTDFNVTFTISNLTFIPDLQNLGSSPYQATSSHVINLLRNLYRKSKIKKAFLHCKLASFRPGNEGKTKVEAICSFKNNPTVNEVDKAIVYNEFRDNTEKITALGEYALNKDSLYVNGYQELKPTITPTVTLPAVREGDLPFELNFTIINRNFTEALNDINSPEYQSIAANITRMLTGLFKKSSLKKSYRTSKVTGLRHGSVKCTCLSYFNLDNTNELVTAEEVRTEFAIGTNETTLLGNLYQLKSNSLTVEAKAPISSNKVEIPYWGIILIVLTALLILFLFVLGGILIALCLKRKYQGSYNMMQNPAGFYFPHQKFY
ncbi:mucin-16-like [Stegostoma tigrinum]|uniref:mucin-16-like n=1 Tax=Stegostoma tigrinum TaxID=3053191 RepID=UPI00286FAF99|nr:mucin-16-like [Stegostoma tigrinum]